tara:strand:- start:123 stop:383 length:261 start_codon:yes stop_codon:yes gene_type:complete
MNSIQITETKNTVSVSETTNTVTITEGVAATVELTTVGPQGPAPLGFIFDGSAKVNDSIVYYHSSSGTFKADATTTKLSLVNGGNF